MHIETSDQSWTVRFAGNRHDLAFGQGALRTTYFGSDFVGPVETIPDHHQNFDRLRESRPEGAVYLKANRDPLLWDTARAEPTETGLGIELRTASLTARLDFEYSEATGALLRRTSLQASGTEPVDIHGALSFSVLLGERVNRMTYLTGAWGHETQVRRIEPDFTSLQLESRSGKTGFEFHPYLALETHTGTTIVELLWSGNWHIHARTREADAILAGGLPETFQARLQPGETLDLPEAIVLRAAGDLNHATQQLHDFRRGRQIGDIARIPVQFNSWYPYSGDPTAEKMIALADVAKNMGCEVFVLDAGWYTNDGQPQSNDLWHSTGEWAVHKGRFPNGVEELSDHCRQIGIGFGIWFEPEGIGAHTRIRETHPEWMHWINGLPPDPARRAILNLGIPAAREWVRDRMLDVLRRTQASWMKWDFNTDLIGGGWSDGAPAELKPRDPVLEHVRGVYLLQREIRAAMPGLVLEMCASGGGRFDGELLRNAHVNWMSDQWQAIKNLAIHFGSHLAHPAKLCNDWLINWPKPAADEARPADASLEWRWDDRGDLKFRLRVAMLGTLGLSCKIDLFTPEEVELTRRHIAWFKDTARDVIETGDQYLLTDPPPLSGNGDWAGIWYTSKDATRGVGYFFRLEGTARERRFALAGLRPDAIYEVTFLDGGSRKLSGKDLAGGIDIAIAGTFDSAVLSVALA